MNLSMEKVSLQEENIVIMKKKKIQFPFFWDFYILECPDHDMIIVWKCLYVIHIFKHSYLKN